MNNKGKYRKPLEGQELLDDMEKYRKEVTKDKESSKNFLIGLGVMTKSGKLKKLIK